MKEVAIDMLLCAIEDIKAGRAKYLILGVLGDEEGQEYSLCSGEPHMREKAKEYLRLMLKDVGEAPKALAQ